MVIREDLEEREILLFTNKKVSKSISEKGSSTCEVLYDLIVMVLKL